jgi:hypothetical protein
MDYYWEQRLPLHDAELELDGLRQGTTTNTRG